MWDKAAALLLSLVGNHALLDGNKRMGITAAALMLFKNGERLVLPEDAAYDLVIAVAERRIVDVAQVAVALQGWAAPTDR